MPRMFVLAIDLHPGASVQDTPLQETRSTSCLRTTHLTRHSRRGCARRSTRGSTCVASPLQLERLPGTASPLPPVDVGQALSQCYPARSQAAKPLSVEIRARPLRRSRRALSTRTAHSRDDFDADAADDARRVAVPTTPRSR